MGQFNETGGDGSSRGARVPYVGKSAGLDPNDTIDSGFVKSDAGMSEADGVQTRAGKADKAGPSRHGQKSFL